MQWEMPMISSRDYLKKENEMQIQDKTEATPMVRNSELPLPVLNPLIGMINFIERCALNQDISVEKMNQLFDIQERMLNKQAEIEYNSAFAEMQAELPPIPADKKGQSGRHFTKGAANILINPVLKQHGFALNFKTTQEGEFIRTRATLRHRFGHSEHTEILLPADVGGNKNKVQAIGSSQSYGERYTMKAILNLTIINDDSDDDADSQNKKKNSFQENMNAENKKPSKPLNPPKSKAASEEKELVWNKKTILLLQGHSVIQDFKSSQEAGERLLKELGAYELKKERSVVMNLNMPLMRALIKKGAGELITRIHKLLDEGK